MAETFQKVIPGTPWKPPKSATLQNVLVEMAAEWVASKSFSQQPIDISAEGRVSVYNPSGKERQSV